MAAGGRLTGSHGRALVRDDHRLPRRSRMVRRRTAPKLRPGSARRRGTGVSSHRTGRPGGRLAAAVRGMADRLRPYVTRGTSRRGSPAFAELLLLLVLAGAGNGGGDLVGRRGVGRTDRGRRACSRRRRARRGQLNRTAAETGRRTGRTVGVGRAGSLAVSRLHDVLLAGAPRGEWGKKERKRREQISASSPPAAASRRLMSA